MNTKNETKNAFALLCRNIYDIQLKFIQKMIETNLYNHYTFFIFIDDNTQNIKEFKNNYPNILFIQIEDKICFEKGYKNMTYSIKKTPVSWDKSIYYFCEIDNSYDYIWFVEDDVFIPNPDAIHFLDHKYPEYDLLTKQNNISFSYEQNGWHWHLAKNNAPLPLFASLVCTLRISKNLLNIIHNYVRVFKKLFFLEIMFTTLNSHSKLKNKIVPELTTIIYRFNWEDHKELIKKNYLYHPIKNLNLQKEIYEKINNLKI